MTHSDIFLDFMEMHHSFNIVLDKLQSLQLIKKLPLKIKLLKKKTKNKTNKAICDAANLIDLKQWF